ncbi:PIG-L deacetylase family protein [Domibacillus enclensis]|uniref:GlcNAc-PI de-N-acetylase n=1 Tax=Domibacillus enclensis TaxID=1017273 RepID=A0A1N6SBB7_9BACI|nr:PIG-L deacetylase family protein [Domibacillus enclensis]OXS79274.1 GlcNAc-PI de-N-acetylase [Domibacillus enclensis]SIQ38433.1 N-acetylglucosaminyl deacetylase, LmbE family [Domibacillus enclensis]
MSKNIMIVTPHPDDETLGCGGTILKEIAKGNKVHWLIVTKMNDQIFDKKQVQKRQREIEQVNQEYQFTNVVELPFFAAELDTVSVGTLVEAISKEFQIIHPEIVYAPYRSDAHSDHKVVYDATMACTKWFRYPSVEKVLVYETLSETDFIMNTDANGFRPNVFIDITQYLNKKIEIMKIYESEISDHPFPRSEKTIRALATLRGAAAGVTAAEAFMLVKERVL